MIPEKPNYKACQYCGKSHPANAVICPETGARLFPEAFNCSKCGNEVPEGEHFCPTCGQGTVSQPIHTIQPLDAPKGILKKPWLRKGLYWGLVATGLVAIGAGAFFTFRPKPGHIIVPTRTSVIVSQAELTGTEFVPTPSLSATDLPASTTPIPPTPTTVNSATPTTTETEQPPTPTDNPTPEPTPTFAPRLVNRNDDAELVHIPAGEFTMGSNESDPYFWGSEAPQHAIILDEFWIYKTEVTNGMYTRCAEEKACPRPAQVHSVISEEYYWNPTYSNYPVIYVTYVDAVSYCKWVGGRLPTEAEWEKAARGTDGRLFPWGDDGLSGDRANFCDNSCSRGAILEVDVDDGYPGPAPVGSFPAGASPYGVLDMAGNVWEWVFDWFNAAYYNVSPMQNPLGPVSGITRVIRGGGWVNSNSEVRTVVRTSLTPMKSLDVLGFRCVVDEP